MESGGFGTRLQRLRAAIMGGVRQAKARSGDGRRARGTYLVRTGHRWSGTQLGLDNKSLLDLSISIIDNGEIAAHETSFNRKYLPRDCRCSAIDSQSFTVRLRTTNAKAFSVLLFLAAVTICEQVLGPQILLHPGEQFRTTF